MISIYRKHQTEQHAWVWLMTGTPQQADDWMSTNRMKGLVYRIIKHTDVVDIDG